MKMSTNIFLYVYIYIQHVAAKSMFAESRLGCLDPVFVDQLSAGERPSGRFPVKPASLAGQCEECKRGPTMWGNHLHEEVLSRLRVNFSTRCRKFFCFLFETDLKRLFFENFCSAVAPRQPRLRSALVILVVAAPPDARFVAPLGCA